MKLYNSSERGVEESAGVLALMGIVASAAINERIST